MRLLAVPLCISIAALLSSGCAVTPVTPVVVQHQFTRCPRPAMHELPELDPGQHVCSPENLERLLTRSDRLCWMIEQQDAALDCYERQVAGGKQ
ncbi:hypothetical protein K9F62_17010 [Desulfovibrio sp. JY]|nr:hypothetical protein K9F62_17010 [Desulfovibrio sp. JY]